MLEATVTAGASEPRLLILSSLFPSAAQPAAGIFIRERMFRVGKHLKIVVLAPQPWFPGQGLIRHFRPHFRPMAQDFEVMSGIEVHRPRYFSVPGVLKRVDGISLALCAWKRARHLVREHRLNILDVHFAYPDGRAGAFLSRRLKLPMVLTLRGKERRESRGVLRTELTKAVVTAERVITVSSALREVAIELGADPNKVTVIGNGIDASKFVPIPQADARLRLKLGNDWRVLVSVGGLVERKGFQRVIEVMPALLRRHPKLHFLIVGGAGPEGDDSERFRAQVRALCLTEHVHFLGAMASDQLYEPLSAADVFVLASSYEGWANVLLEAMACGLPVVATDVGGNAQVVSDEKLGSLTPFGDSNALTVAIDSALQRTWNREKIREYALANEWDRRIPVLLETFNAVLKSAAWSEPGPGIDVTPGGHSAQ